MSGTTNLGTAGKEEAAAATVERTDVLVIGAGPAGLMAALALGRYGVKTIVIDRRAADAVYGNADGFQPGTIEMWDSFGLREQLMREGHPVVAYSPWITDEKTGEIKRQPQGPDIAVADARFPYEVILPIERIEGILRDAAAASGVAVAQPYAPTALTISDAPADAAYPVQVSIARPSADGDATEGRTIHAKYVIGCDGARSWVRDALGVAMEKAERDEDAINWGVLTCAPKTDFPDTTTKTVLTTPVCGMIGWIPHPHERARLYVPLSPDFDPKTRTRDEFLKDIQATLDKVFKPYKVDVSDCDWLSNYRVVQAVAATFAVKRRVFIAGDAAHTHSAKAGQGANASMRDTHNLAWKIAYVLRGWAKPELLDTYDDERRTYARELIALDRDISKAFEIGGSDGKYKKIWDDKNRFISGIGIIYHSALTPEHAPSPLAPGISPGERLPPAALTRLSDWRQMHAHDLLASDGLFKLILFPGDMRASRDTVGQFAAALGDIPALAVSAVFRNDKASVHWTEAPEAVRDRYRVFVDDTSMPVDAGALERACACAYAAYGIGAAGCAVLVRPDQMVSAIYAVSAEGGAHARAFLTSL